MKDVRARQRRRAREREKNYRFISSIFAARLSKKKRMSRVRCLDNTDVDLINALSTDGPSFLGFLRGFQTRKTGLFLRANT